jgi:1-acyl-sn-glycerol-3-phosphate acyltransferase
MTSDNEQLAYRFARGLIRPTLGLATRHDWRGTTNIPATGGCVVAANHLSHFDPLTLAHFIDSAGRAPRFLGKSEVFEVPLLGRIVAGAGQIAVYRETVDAARALRAAVDAVHAGECVVLYPEGTLTRDPDLWPMAGKTGAARIAMLTGCPVIPVAQWGPQLVLGRYQRVPRLIPRRQIQVRAGVPVDLADLAEQPATGEVLRSATSTIMRAIVGLLEQIRGERGPEVLFDPRVHTDVSRVGNPNKPPRRRPKGD